MQVIKDQYLSFNSLLSYKTRSTYKKLGELISHIYSNIECLGFREIECMIFSLKENQATESRKILDLEFLIPLDKCFESNEHYVYKPYFRLENAIKVKHIDSLDTLSKSKRKLQEYLVKNDLSPITDFYYLILRRNGIDAVDIYVGLNGNVF